MTWTPKPGDKVTSPLLVGEWTVERNGVQYAHLYVPGPTGATPDATAAVPRDTLAPVAPPLPPEPPTGTVVWDGERYWQRSGGSWSSARSAGVWRDVKDWSQIAADAVPVVPVNKVAHWLRQNDCEQWCAMTEERFLAEFGGFDGPLPKVCPLDDCGCNGEAHE